MEMSLRFIAEHIRKGSTSLRVSLVSSLSLFRTSLAHKSFDDHAAAVGSEEEQLKAFRRGRDEIKDWVAQKFGK